VGNNKLLHEPYCIEGTVHNWITVDNEAKGNAIRGVILQQLSI